MPQVLVWKTIYRQCTTTSSVVVVAEIESAAKGILIKYSQVDFESLESLS